MKGNIFTPEKDFVYKCVMMLAITIIRCLFFFKIANIFKRLEVKMGR